MKNWRQLDPEYDSERERYPHPVPSRAFILSTLTAQKRSLSCSALAALFELNRDEKATFRHRIKAMLRDDQLEERGNGKLRPAKARPALTGTVFAHAEGFGFFIPDDNSLTGGEDLFLSYHAMRGVMHGDKVEARLLESSRKGKKEGKIVRVLERANTHLLGRAKKSHGEWTITAENRRITHAITVTNLSEVTLSANDVVELKITAYPRDNQPIRAEIVRVLGDKMAMGMEIDIAIANHKLPHTWNDEVRAQTDALAEELQPEDYRGRVDIRHLPLVTIDGITARDFDDAVFAKKTPAGYKLLVAIADVAHYVPKDSPLDVEATARATSVYFPNRVIPMLPEKLSNGLCSLNPQVDRLCMVCEMLINAQGEITRSRFYEGVMHSHARLTYETIEDVLFNDSADLPDAQSYLLPHLQTLKSLYAVLRQQRDARGAIDFRTTEPEFEYDAEGKIAHISARKNLKSHQLIEEFMVRANVCAAKFLLKQRGKNRPIALYRNHLGPSDKKHEKLVASLAQEGIKLSKTEAITPKQLAVIVEKIKLLPNFDAIQLLILRSMYQAVYQPENAGHFGLSLEHYAHFTSPIRRYPDLLVHRAIKHATRHKGEPYVYTAEQMQRLGEQCSMAERRADEAVYDVIGELKCEYMLDKLGQHFHATISSVTSFGLFATLDGEFVDGLVHISSLEGDYFHFDEQRRQLVGERSHKVYQVGDAIEVIISNVSVEARRIDFILQEAYLPFAGKAGKKHGKHAKSKRKDNRNSDDKGNKANKHQSVKKAKEKSKTKTGKKGKKASKDKQSKKH